MATANFWDTPTPRGFLPVGTVTEPSDHTGTKRALLPSDCSFILRHFPFRSEPMALQRQAASEWEADFHSWLRWIFETRNFLLLGFRVLEEGIKCLQFVACTFC